MVKAETAGPFHRAAPGPMRAPTRPCMWSRRLRDSLEAVRRAPRARARATLWWEGVAAPAPPGRPRVRRVVGPPAKPAGPPGGRVGAEAEAVPRGFGQGGAGGASGSPGASAVATAYGAAGGGGSCGQNGGNGGPGFIYIQYF